MWQISSTYLLYVYSCTNLAIEKTQANQVCLEQGDLLLFHSDSLEIKLNIINRNIYGKNACQQIQ